MTTTTVYFLQLNNDHTSLDRYLSCLNSEDRERWLRFKNRRRAKQLLAARFLVHYHLKTTAQIPVSNGYELSNYSKWKLSNCDREFSISISHSKDWVCIAVGEHNSMIGIDIEIVKPRSIPDLLPHFATYEEQQYVMAQKNKMEAFYSLWTLKEAYIKMSGLPLHTVKKINLLPQCKKDELRTANYCSSEVTQEFCWSLIIGKGGAEAQEVIKHCAVEGDWELY